MRTAGPERGGANVVIIGGGVIGVSIAFHLAEAGVTGVVVLERDEPGDGSSGKPIGGIRAQFSDPVNIELGARSLRAFQDFPGRPGRDIGLDTVGYLFLLSTEEQGPAFAKAVATQNDLGVPSRLITPAEARRRCPYIETAGIIAATFSPSDGHARPPQVVKGYAQAAARRGVLIRPRSEVIELETGGDRITAVRTVTERIECGTVICAAGAWSARVGTLAGIHLPVRPVRRQLVFAAPPDPPAPRLPFTIDAASTLYFHNAGDGLLVGLSDPGQPEGFDNAWTEDWLVPFRSAARRVAPALAALTPTGGWAGLYEVTPDHNALIGRSSAVPNFLYATGFSGHGFLQAPAVGEVVRDLYLDRPPAVDVRALDADRFSHGGTGRSEAHIV